MTDKKDKELMSLLPRGDEVKRPSPIGTSLFVGLRAADVFIQYGILANHLASPLLNALRIPHISSFATPGPTAIAFGLPLKPLIVLGMAAGTFIKQGYWVLNISNEEMTVPNAIAISMANVVFNSSHSILALTAASDFLTNSAPSKDRSEASPLFLFFSATYIVGVLIEVVSEIQRRNFKLDPKNKGKPYTGGLFGLARHINLGGYVLMRTSYALACGGWVAGAVVLVNFAYDFTTRAIPILDEYCAKRYGEDWKVFKKEVRWKLMPGIY